VSRHQAKIARPDPLNYDAATVPRRDSVLQRVVSPQAQLTRGACEDQTRVPYDLCALARSMTREAGAGPDEVTRRVRFTAAPAVIAFRCASRDVRRRDERRSGTCASQAGLDRLERTQRAADQRLDLL